MLRRVPGFCLVCAILTLGHSVATPAAPARDGVVAVDGAVSYALSQFTLYDSVAGEGLGRRAPGVAAAAQPYVLS